MVVELESRGLQLGRMDREGVPTDSRYLDLLLRAAGDPEVGREDMPRECVLDPRCGCHGSRHHRNKNDDGVSQEQAGPTGPLRTAARRGRYLEKELCIAGPMEREGSRGTKRPRASKSEARRRFLDLVVGVVGNEPQGQTQRRSQRKVAIRRDARTVCKPTYTDQRPRKTPFASDLKRALREKSKLGELTFALSAEVSEAHRQVSIHPQDWPYLGCQVNEGSEVFIHTVGTFGVVLLVPGCGINWKACTVRSVEDPGTEWV